MNLPPSRMNTRHMGPPPTCSTSFLSTHRFFSSSHTNGHDNKISDHNPDYDDDNININNNTNVFSQQQQDQQPHDNDHHHQQRRSFLSWSLASFSSCVCGALSSSLLLPFSGEEENNVVHAMVGTLPELSNTNIVLQSITIQVSDRMQQNAMIQFLQDGFDMMILRKQRRHNKREETWLGYGPEQVSIPSNFVLPASSFRCYGGHTSIHIICQSN